MTKQNAKQPAGIVHVRPVSHASESWFRETPESAALFAQELALVQIAEAEWTAAEAVGAPLHLEGAHEAIAAELVACTLGARRRPELQTDLAS